MDDKNLEQMDLENEEKKKQIKSAAQIVADMQAKKNAQIASENASKIVAANLTEAATAQATKKILEKSAIDTSINSSYSDRVNSDIGLAGNNNKYTANEFASKDLDKSNDGIKEVLKSTRTATDTARNILKTGYKTGKLAGKAGKIVGKPVVQAAENVGNKVGLGPSMASVKNTVKGIRKATSVSKAAAGKLFSKLGAVLSRVLVALMPFLGWIVLILIAVLAIFFLVVFILSGPSMLWGQLGQMADELGTAIKTAYVSITEGDDYADITKQQLVDVANYIDLMGFDLVGYGFVKQEEKNNLKIDEKTEQVTDLESDYLMEYIAAENRTYMISTVSLNSLYRWWNGVSIFGRNESIDLSGQGNIGEQNAKLGTGMIDISTGITAVDEIRVQTSNGLKVIQWDKVKDRDSTGNNTNNGSSGANGTDGRATLIDFDVEPEVDRAQRKLKLKITEEYRLSTGQIREEETTCVYNLEGWSGRYGKPFEFLLSLHLGTMSPEFTEAVATRKEFDTKVNIKIHKSVQVTELTFYYEGQEYKLDDWYKLVATETRKILNWYRNFVPNYPEEEAKKQAIKLIGITEADIEDAIKYQQTGTKENYTPYIVSVENHWYKDLKFKDLNTASTKDAYVVTRDSVTTGRYKNKFIVNTYKSGDIYQVKDPEYSYNTYFTELFQKGDWKTVDGVTGFVENTTNAGKITLGDDMQNAIVMLNKAAQESEDAKFILRDLKQWLEDMEYKLTDSYILTNKVINDEEENTTSGNMGSSTGNSSSSGSTTGSTTVEKSRLNNLLNGSTANIIYSGNDATVKTSEMQAGTTVRSIVNGTVSKIDADSVQIKITSPSNLKDNVLIMSNVKMDSGLKEGTTVSNTSPIAETVAGKDILIRMQDPARNSISVKDNLKY